SLTEWGWGNDRGQGQRARTSDRPEHGIQRSQTVQRRAERGQGNGRVASEDGAAPRRRAAHAAARRAPHRGDGAAARYAPRRHSGPDALSTVARRRGKRTHTHDL